MVTILGVDAGNSRVKVYGDRGADMFLSVLGEHRDLKLTNTLLKDDMIYEYNSVKGFAGTLAKRESEFGGSMMGTSKAHPDMLIRVLIALHRYAVSDNESFGIVVGQPIINHTDTFKSLMKDMLIGQHLFTLNGVKRDLNIEWVGIGPEGASAHWSSPKSGKVRIIDVGSATVNIATIIDGMYIDKESNTFDFGLNTNLSTDKDAFCRRVAINCLKKWKKSDEVYIMGGYAEQLQKHMQYYFRTVKVLRPQVTINSTLTLISPIFANAVAFYNMARKVYENGLQHQG